MTREEAEALLDSFDTYDYGNDAGYDIVGVDNLLDKIYDDFEARTCENCKKIEDCFLLKINHNYTRVKTFTCGDWKGKENE